MCECVSVSEQVGPATLRPSLGFGRSKKERMDRPIRSWGDSGFRVVQGLKFMVYDVKFVVEGIWFIF